MNPFIVVGSNPMSSIWIMSVYVCLAKAEDIRAEAPYNTLYADAKHHAYKDPWLCPM